MTDIEILIEILKNKEVTGGHQPITVSMLRCFLEEVEKIKDDKSLEQILALNKKYRI